jgi:UDP-2,4-diacetamido-2,4,6-trideoxy-beta-L-altropyranose hydrolase
MRCLTLADELRHQGHQCRFISRDHQGHLGGFITRKGFALDLLSIPDVPDVPDVDCRDGGETAHAHWLGVNWQIDAEQTLAALESIEVYWLVVDHYALDARWEKRLAVVVKRILVIDDLADRSHECDLLLDQNLGRQEADYDQRVPADCERLIGPRYALLRPEFAKRREASLQRLVKPKLKRILISLGGVDANNTSGKVLSALSDSTLPIITELDIIMGATSPHLEEVRKQAAQLPFQATVNVNVNDMAERMCRADISIGAAGSTSWERCCLGLPSIMVILAENQRAIGNALEQNGCAHLIVENRIADDLGPLLSSLMKSGAELEKLANNAMRVCDGEGCSRLVSEMTRDD